MTQHCSLLSLKRHPATVFLYNAYLTIRCRKVRAYIFVATTGRTGTASLRRIFEEALPGAVCLHEPHPIMISEYPRQPQANRDEYFRRLFFTLKRLYIRRAAARHTYYVETNHQFIKNFATHAIRCLQPKIRIIHLKRDPVSIARSFYALDSIPSKTARGRHYMLDVEDPTNIIQLPVLCNGNGEFSHDFYKCLWYWYETEARIKTLKALYPGVPWATITTDQLNDKGALETMFRSLGITPSLAYLERGTSVRENLRSEEKTDALDLSQCEEMNRTLRRKIEEIYGPAVLSE